MIDELKVRLAEQGIGYDEYLRATERDEAKLREEYREPAEHRVKVLLTLAAVADAEGVVVPNEAIEAEIERSRQSAARSSGDRDASRERLAPGRIPRVRARPVVHPLAAAPLADRRRASSTAGSRPIPKYSEVRHVEDQPDDEIERAADRSVLSPDTDDAEGPESMHRHIWRRGPVIRGGACSRGSLIVTKVVIPNRSQALRAAQETTAMLVPMVIESIQPRRARLRHLQPPAARSDHLPRRRDRGPRREPDHRPAAVPRGRGPGARHQPVHQLAWRRGDQRPRHLRHDAVPARAGQHHVHRHGRVDGVGAAGGRAPRASATRCRTPGS